MNIKYCKKCLIPNTRPGITFDDEGVCVGCRYYESLYKIDWNHRRKEIEDIVSWAKAHPSDMGYDSIVSVSGGKDSTRLALYARDNLGLNPLLVSTVTPPEMVTEIGVKNLENLVNLGFDLISLTPDPVTYKKLVRKGFLLFGNYCKATEMVLYITAHNVAVNYGIPLNILGENPALVHGDTSSKEDGGDASNLKNINTLAGGDIEWMLGEGVERENLIAYMFPDFQKHNVRSVYLGYYIRDFANLINGLFSVAHGLNYRCVKPEDIGALFNFGALDDDFVVINQMLKYFKFGWGKASEEISELIKLGVMDRDTGIRLAKKLDGKCNPKYIESFCKYIGISMEEFWSIADGYRNPNIWEKNERGWKFNTPLFQEIDI